MEKKTVRVWFCSPDEAFAEKIISALGEDFEVRRTSEFTLRRDPELEDWWDVILVDLHAAEITSQADLAPRFLQEISQFDLAPPAIVILPSDELALSRKLLAKGAFDVLASPPIMTELRFILKRAHRFRQMEREAHRLRAQERIPERFHELIGASESMQQVFALGQKIAPCDVSVFITGETGTGKELLARAIHRLSGRASQPFVAFSCANLPETLVEDELFGHEKGAFTGALQARRGRLEMADGGTLFLDEIGDLGLALQPKLLRVLQERTFERLGSNSQHSVNLRLICATHQDLEKMVQQGKFREDLYYRLNVVQLHLPPLRERKDDILLLAQHLLDRFAKHFGKEPRRFSHAALQALEEYVWPGNVRELENVVQRAVVLAEGTRIEICHLPATLRDGFDSAPLGSSYEGEVREFKRRLILRTLHQCGWSKTETARTLGVARNYLYRLINQFQIQEDAEEAPQDLPEPRLPTDRMM